MPEPIANLSAESVIEAIEQNMVDSSVALGRTEDGVVFRGSDVTWVYTGYPTLSRVLRARFTAEEAEDRVAEIAECFNQWDAPVLWVMGPSTWPPQLPEYLHNSGFGHYDNWMGMAVDLGKMSPRAPVIDSFRIDRVTEAEHLKIWTDLSGEAWRTEIPESAVQIFSPENAGGDSRCRYYLGYLGDEPVVRGMVYVSEATAGLYWVATGPKHSGRGYDVALAIHALSEACQGGAKLAVMPVRDIAHPVCAGLGFKPYCQFNVYEWPKPPLRLPIH